MSIQRLHHAQITIPSAMEAQAREFYCGVLGLPEIEKPDALKARGGFWVLLDDVQIHISLEDGVERSHLKAHLAYQVDNLDVWRDKLTSCGLMILESVQFAGYVRFETRDPFGNRMEFIQPIE